MSVYEDRSLERRDSLTVALERFVAVARLHPDVCAVYVFGSYAREEIGPNSDLDLLVVRETTRRGPVRGEDLVMEALLGIDFDLHVLTPEEYRVRASLSSYWADVIGEARLVYAA